MSVVVTRDEILKIIVQHHQQRARLWRLEPVALTLDTTVWDWRRASHLPAWPLLGKALNQRFGTVFSNEEWRSVLTPGTSRTLGEVVDLLSQQATCIAPREIIVLGRRTIAGGMFFALCMALQDAGLSLQRVRPSTALGAVVGRNTECLAAALYRLSNERVPAIRSVRPGYALNAALILGLLGGAIVAAKAQLAIALIFFLLLAVVSVWVYLDPPPFDVRVDQARTLGELAIYLCQNRIVPER